MYKFEDDYLNNMEQMEYEQACIEARASMALYDALPKPLRMAVSMTTGQVPLIVHPNYVLQACQILEANQHRIVEKRKK